MTLAKRLGKKFKAELSGRLIAKFANAVLVAILARELDPDGYGLLFLAISVFSIVQIASRMGIAKSAARYISEYRVDDPGQVPYLLKRSLLYNLITIGLVSISFHFVTGYISNLLGEPDMNPLLSIGFLYITFGTLTMYGRNILQGFENIQLSARINILNRSSQLVIVTAFIALGFGVSGALWGMIGGFFIASIFSIWYIFSKYYGRSDGSEPDKNLYKNLRRYGVPLAFTDLALKLDGQVDTLLVGFFLNPIQVGFYALSKQIAEFVQMPASALGFSTAPTYSEQKNKEKTEVAAKLFEKSLTHTLLMYIPGAVGIVLISPAAIPLVFGDDYSGAIPVIQVFSIYTILLSLTKLTDYPLDYLGRARSRAIANGVSSMLNVGLNIVLIPTVGVIGAAAATVVTHSLYVAFKIHIIKNELPVRFKLIAKHGLKVLFVSSVMGSVVWVLLPYIDSLLTCAGVIGIGLFVWGILSYSTGAIDRSLVKNALM